MKMTETQFRTLMITALLITCLVILALHPTDEMSDRLEGMLYVLTPAFLDSVRVTRRELTTRAKS